MWNETVHNKELLSEEKQKQLGLDTSEGEEGNNTDLIESVYYAVYDGEDGKVKIFSPKERETNKEQMTLF